MLIKWIKKFFGMNSKNMVVTNNADTVKLIPPDIMSKVRIPRKFEIFVEEFDEEKEPGEWRPIRVDTKLGGNGNPVITVNSQQDMAEKVQFYQQLKQRFRIVREIDPPSVEQILEAAKAQGLDISNVHCIIDGANSKNLINNNQQLSTRIEHANINTSDSDRQEIVEMTSKSKPRIIKIGDIQIKYDGDKVYQRQWVRLSPDEESNFRVINSSNNKIVSMNGKHIEAKKWIIIDQTEDNSLDIEKMVE